jgi:hypothetical protein
MIDVIFFCDIGVHSHDLSFGLLSDFICRALKDLAAGAHYHAGAFAGELSSSRLS